MTALAWEALAILVALGGLVSLFIWAVCSAVGEAAGDARRDRARSWSRDV